jgi:hypothetical protein
MCRALAAALLAMAAGCATRTQPYRFASPMIGGADVPPPRLPTAAPSRAPRAQTLANHAPAHTTSATGMAGIEVAAPPLLASAEAADAVPHTGVVFSHLPAPHRVPADALLPAIHTPLDLRALVGRRTKADPFALSLEWANALGAHVAVPDAREPLLSWARESGALLPLDTPIQPGDLLVFDQIESDQDADLIAVVIARDERNVAEYAYVSGGVIRRGFVDPNRPALRRDHEGVIVNTFMRSGRRWPPKGTHYLAGELLANVIRPH